MIKTKANRSFDEVIDDATHVAMDALGLDVESNMKIAEELNDYLRSAMRGLLPEDVDKDGDRDFNFDSPDLVATQPGQSLIGTVSGAAEQDWNLALMAFRACRRRMTSKAYGALVNDSQWDSDDPDTFFLVYGDTEGPWFIEILPDDRFVAHLGSDSEIAEGEEGLARLERKLFEHASREQLSSDAPDSSGPGMP